MTVPPPRFSVLVPTLDEETEIAGTLARIRRAFGGQAEIIVSDGGSRDRTAELVRKAARVVDSPANRGAQLEAAARLARGDILVLLHADTWPPESAARAIEAAVRKGAVAGCFRVGIRGGGRARFALLSAAINLRTRVFRTATGDQGIFATREAYDRSGGVEPIPLFEDVRLVRALRRTGPFAILPERVETSARRWERDGFLRTVCRHLSLRARHALGASPERLATRYRRADPISGPKGPPS